MIWHRIFPLIHHRMNSGWMRKDQGGWKTWSLTELSHLWRIGLSFWFDGIEPQRWGNWIGELIDEGVHVLWIERNTVKGMTKGGKRKGKEKKTRDKGDNEMVNDEFASEPRGRKKKEREREKGPEALSHLIHWSSPIILLILDAHHNQKNRRYALCTVHPGTWHGMVWYDMVWHDDAADGSEMDLIEISVWKVILYLGMGNGYGGWWWWWW